MVDHLIYFENTFHWNISVFSAARLVIGVHSIFMDTIYSIKVRRSGVDELCWNPSKRVAFEVKSY